jgi:diguanylate cyclase (GGDEF)-like protein
LGVDVPTLRSVIAGAVAVKAFLFELVFHVKLGLVNLQVGTWWLAAATFAVLMGMMWWCARTLSQTDRVRRTLEKRLVELASQDPLTGLFNRHRFAEELDELLARSQRTGESGSLLLLDLDRLKPVNDAFGHAIGDRMLRAVADLLTGRLRATDAVGRLGGDEFAALLLGASPLDAVTIANALLATIAEIAIETERGSAWTSASIGVTSIDAVLGTEPSEFLGRADAAMHRAKRAGGNQVVSTERPPVGAPLPVRESARQHPHDLPMGARAGRG